MADGFEHGFVTVHAWASLYSSVLRSSCPFDTRERSAQAHRQGLTATAISVTIEAGDKAWIMGRGVCEWIGWKM
jgi:hypothetical protein